MKINLNKIQYYFLTHQNPTRKKHILNEFKDYRLQEVNPIINSTFTKQKSGATGFLKILKKGFELQNKKKAFKPFVIFEDDVKKYREFPEEITIPQNTDILYIGISSEGIYKNNIVRKTIYKSISNELVRVFNMFSLHGIIICSLKGLLMLRNCMIIGFNKNIIWDIFIAKMQPYLNAYALKKPLVYQYKKIGGQEIYTKIEFT